MVSNYGQVWNKRMYKLLHWICGSILLVAWRNSHTSLIFLPDQRFPVFEAWIDPYSISFQLNVFPHPNLDNGMFAQQPAHCWPLLPGLWERPDLSETGNSGGCSRREGSREFTVAESLKAFPWGMTSRHRWWLARVIGLSDSRAPTQMLALGWEKLPFLFLHSFSFMEDHQCSLEIPFPFPLLPKDSGVLVAPSPASSIFSPEWWLPHPHCALSLPITSHPTLPSPTGDLYLSLEHFPS